MPEMLIGGEWRQAAAHEEIEVVNPATEDVVDSVPAGAPEDVELAVATAKRAFAEWSRTDVEKRAAILAKAADLIHEHAKELAATLTSEQGKPVAEAMGEVTHLAHGVRYYAEAATKVRGSYQDLPSTLGPAYGMVIRRPMGVCAAITPYNFPLTLLGHQGRTGAGDGQHGGGQARGHDAAGHARGGAPVLRGRRARRRAQRGHRARLGHRRRARRPPRRPPRGLHRLDRGGAARRQARRARPQAPVARARRLRSRDRVRRRRRRRRGQGRDHRPLLERRARRAWAASGCSCTTASTTPSSPRSSSASAATSPATARSRPRSRRLRMGPIHTRAGRDELLEQIESGVASGGELLIGGGTGGARQGLVPGAGGHRRARAPTRALMTEEVFGPVLPVLRFTDFDDAIAPRQRHALRAGLLDLDPRRAAHPPRGAGDRLRHDLGQPDPLRL